MRMRISCHALFTVLQDSPEDLSNVDSCEYIWYVLSCVLRTNVPNTELSRAVNPSQLVCIQQCTV